MKLRNVTSMLAVSALLFAVTPMQPALAHSARVCAAPATTSVMQTAACMTHLSTRQIASRRAEGTSLSQICRDRSVDPASVVSTALSKYRRSLQAAVGHGLTQAQADYRLRVHRRAMERFMDACHGNAGGSGCTSRTADPSCPATPCPNPSCPATGCPAPSCPATCPSAPETSCPGPNGPNH